MSIIESTQFELFPSSCRARQNRATDYQCGRTGPGAAFVYYDPHERRKIDEAAAKSRAATTRVIPDDAPRGWDYDLDEVDVERQPRDWSRDYIPYVAAPATLFMSQPSPATISYPEESVVAAVGQAATGSDPSTLSSETKAAIVRTFLVDAVILPSSSNMSSVDEMRGYLRGRMGL